MEKIGTPLKYMTIVQDMYEKEQNNDRIYEGKFSYL